MILLIFIARHVLYLVIILLCKYFIVGFYLLKRTRHANIFFKLRCLNADDYRLAIPYYRMASIMPFDVLKRVKKIQEQSNNHHVCDVLYISDLILFDDNIILF